jgi:hypothetical protein
VIKAYRQLKRGAYIFMSFCYFGMKFYKDKDEGDEDE